MFRLAIRRPVAVIMITTAAALFGVLAYGQLGMALMPEMAYPTLTVRTRYAGAAPEEIETEITRDVESRIGTIGGLVGMTSSSRAGVSDVVLEFDWDADMNQAANRVRERLGNLDVPRGAERPVLLRYDPTQEPVMSLAIGAGSGALSLAELRAYAVETLSLELAKIEGVAATRVVGGEEREIQVRLDPVRLAGRRLTVRQVVDRLAAANVNLAGGKLKEGSVEFLVRTLAEVRTAGEIGQIVVLERQGTLVRVADLGAVREGVEQRVGMARVGGGEAVRIDLFREGDGNIVEVCDRVVAAVFGSAEQRAFVAGLSPAERQGLRQPSARRSRRRHGGGHGRQPEQRRFREMTRFVAFSTPAGIELSVVSDQSRFIRAALDEVRQAALVGGLLAVLMLYLFLRSGYSTLVIGIAIPLSVALTFVPMMLFGVTLNVMSLGGLALGIGMLVDNAVVVLESIHRCRDEGDDRVGSAVRGVQEVGGAVVASTLTTVAVFFPIVFVEGVAGQVFGDLALAVVFSLLASLLVALFVVPMLASRRLTPQPVEGPARWSVPLQALPWWWGLRGRGWGALWMLPCLPYVLLRALLEILASVSIAGFSIIGGALVIGGRLAARLIQMTLWPLAALAGWLLEISLRAYPSFLRGALRLPLLVGLVVGGLGALAWRLAGDLGAELIPEVRQGALIAELRFPVGTPLVETARRVAGLERGIAALPAVVGVESFIGVLEEGGEEAGDRGPHTARVKVRLRAADAATEDATARQIRQLAARVPALELDLGRPALFSLRPPIQVIVSAQHLGLLRQVASRITEALSADPGLTDLRTSVRSGYPEVQIRYDRERLASLGLDPRMAAERVRGQLDGEIATELRQHDASRQPVRVRVDPDRLASRADLRGLVIEAGEGVPIPLEAVAALHRGEGPAEIRHVEGQRAVVISARTRSGLDLDTVAAGVRALLARVELPAGVEVELLGQDEEMKTSLESLKHALWLAIFLVYVVMASQFESLRAPLVIMGSLPLAAIGVLLVLGALKVPLSVVVFIGMITLAGIVVNNAIVLVDYTGQLRRRGRTLEEAIVQAGRARLRPILMTTSTTVLGLLPLALGRGEGAELRQPMALTLIAGLVFATGLTLVVIPVLYRLVMRPLRAQGSSLP